MSASSPHFSDACQEGKFCICPMTPQSYNHAICRISGPGMPIIGATGASNTAQKAAACELAGTVRTYGSSAVMLAAPHRQRTRGAPRGRRRRRPTRVGHRIPQSSDARRRKESQQRGGACQTRDIRRPHSPVSPRVADLQWDRAIADERGCEDKRDPPSPSLAESRCKSRQSVQDRSAPSPP